MKLYDELNISEDSTQEEIKATYHKAAKENHPDKNGSVEKMQRINQAYMILRDPDKRTQYDKTGDENQINNDVSRISSIVCNIISSFIEKPPYNIMQAVSDIKSSIEQKRRAELRSSKIEKKKIEEFKKRILKFPQDKSDIIGFFLDKQLNGINQRIKAIEKDFELHLKAFELFEKYEFKVIVDPMVKFIDINFTIGSTSSGW